MKRIVLGVFLISLIFVGYYVGLLMKPSPKGGVSVTLVVRQYRDGKLIKEVVEKKDPFTNNFVQLLWSLMRSGARTSPSVTAYTMTDVGGTSRTLLVSGYYNNGGSSYRSDYMPLYGTGNYIWIGNGNTPFSITDYKLWGTSILKAATSAPSESVLDPKINYTISASFSLSSAMTISEIGYSRILRVSDWYNYEFLLMRDVLSTPISALAGDTVTVTYIIRING